jgi:hypothetical protein
MLKILVVAAMLGSVPAIAFAQVPSSSCFLFIFCPPPPHKAAPAPLLAAGIPAFAALGGVAGIGRLLRRRRKTALQTTEI